MSEIYVNTPFGFLKICASAGAVRSAAFCEAAGSCTVFPEDNAVLEEAQEWLDLYFCGIGESPRFRLEPRLTDFQKKVFFALSQIPFGETVSYSALARLVFGPEAGTLCARAIGQALTRNPCVLFIPCHRVVCADGRAGGYAYGEERKAGLIRMEKSYRGR